MLNKFGQDCPWYSLHEKFGGPTLKWCEERLCTYFNEPLNTWTNIPYLIVALFIYGKSNKHPSWAIRSFAPVVFLMGLFSFAYHMMNNFAVQVLDFLGMFLFTTLIISINIQRLFPLQGSFRLSLYFIIVGVNLLLIPLFQVVNLPIQFIIVLNILAILTLEMMSFSVNGRALKYRYLVTAVSFIIAGEIFSLLDLKRIICDPSNHFFQGHALWHVLSAISAYYAFLHYRQFEKGKDTK